MWKLCLPSSLLRGTSLALLSLTVEVLPLLVRSHSTEGTLALLLLGFLGGLLTFLSLLFLVNAAEALGFTFAGVADLARDLCTEVADRNELVGETEELREKRKGGGVGRCGGGKDH